MQGNVLSRSTVGAFLLIVLACWLVGVQHSLVLANPAASCEDCDCKEVAAWSYVGLDYAYGFRHFNGGTGKYESVAHATIEIGSPLGCQKSPTVPLQQDLYRYKYSDVKQLCDINVYELIEYSFKDKEGDKTSETVYKKHDCTK